MERLPKEALTCVSITHVKRESTCLMWTKVRTEIMKYYVAIMEIVAIQHENQYYKNKRNAVSVCRERKLSSTKWSLFCSMGMNCVQLRNKKSKR